MPSSTLSVAPGETASVPEFVPPDCSATVPVTTAKVPLFLIVSPWTTVVPVPPCLVKMPWFSTGPGAKSLVVIEASSVAVKLAPASIAEPAAVDDHQVAAGEGGRTGVLHRVALIDPLGSGPRDRHRAARCDLRRAGAAAYPPVQANVPDTVTVPVPSMTPPASARFWGETAVSASRVPPVTRRVPPPLTRRPAERTSVPPSTLSVAPGLVQIVPELVPPDWSATVPVATGKVPLFWIVSPWTTVVPVPALLDEHAVVDDLAGGEVVGRDRGVVGGREGGAGVDRQPAAVDDHQVAAREGGRAAVLHRVGVVDSLGGTSGERQHRTFRDRRGAGAVESPAGPGHRLRDRQRAGAVDRPARENQSGCRRGGPQGKGVGGDRQGAGGAQAVEAVGLRGRDGDVGEPDRGVVRDARYARLIVRIEPVGRDVEVAADIGRPVERRQ